MGIASIARYSLAVIQRSSDSAFAGGSDSAFAIAAFTRGSVIGGCVCKWPCYFSQSNVRSVCILDQEGNCKTEYQLICHLSLIK